MAYFARFSPVIAYRDLRAFLASRERYEFGFLLLAAAITAFLVWVFVRESHEPVPYKREIVYVKQWRLDRTDAEIKAQQLIDEAAKQKQRAIDDAERERRRQEFQRLDDKLTNMGF